MLELVLIKLHMPTQIKEVIDTKLVKKTTTTTKKKSKLKFIDLFAGIGGFHFALHDLGMECVFASEIDEKARLTYEANFKDISPNLFQGLGMPLFNKDITKIDPKDIPDHDILCGGFPCQPFSNVGKRNGFEDTRGTLFFNIAQIIKIKQPQAFFLENVQGLLNHDNGKTFETIKRVVTQDLGYSFYYKIIKASDYGLPQHRPRLYIVGFKNRNINYEFASPISLKYNMSYVMGGKVPKEIGYTLRCGGRGSGLGDRRNWDSYLVDGVEKRLNPTQGLLMQGFPENFVFPVTHTQAMRQLGNSVAVDAVRATAKNIQQALQINNFFKKTLHPEDIFVYEKV
jgi:DNA (cytosine-5)-methyltransferase 1